MLSVKLLLISKVLPDAICGAINARSPAVGADTASALSERFKVPLTATVLVESVELPPGRIVAAASGAIVKLLMVCAVEKFTAAPESTVKLAWAPRFWSNVTAPATTNKPPLGTLVADWSRVTVAGAPATETVSAPAASTGTVSIGVPVAESPW